MEAVAADADAVAQGPVVALHEVEEPTLGVDDDRPGRFVGAEEHLLLFKGASELLLVRRRLIAGLVGDIHFVLARNRGLRIGERARKDGERRAKRGRAQNDPLELSCVLRRLEIEE